jgi:hypothetical protein
VSEQEESVKLGGEICGYEVELDRGSKVWAAEVSKEKGGRYVFVFTNKDGETARLALSGQAFDAVASLHERLRRPVARGYRIVAELLDAATSSDWMIDKPASHERAHAGDNESGPKP